MEVHMQFSGAFKFLYTSLTTRRWKQGQWNNHCRHLYYVSVYTRKCLRHMHFPQRDKVCIYCKMHQKRSLVTEEHVTTCLLLKKKKVRTMNMICNAYNLQTHLFHCLSPSHTILIRKLEIFYNKGYLFLAAFFVCHYQRDITRKGHAAIFDILFWVIYGSSYYKIHAHNVRFGYWCHSVNQLCKLQTSVSTLFLQLWRHLKFGGSNRPSPSIWLGQWSL